jgi:hypothetical protein
METRCVADVEGAWVDPNFGSSLIERCRQYWTVPISHLPDIALATYLEQRIAVALILPEAKKRVDSGSFDESEFFDGQLAEAVRKVS